MLTLFLPNIPFSIPNAALLQQPLSPNISRHSVICNSYTVSHASHSELYYAISSWLAAVVMSGVRWASGRWKLAVIWSIVGLGSLVRVNLFQERLTISNIISAVRTTSLY